MNYKLFKHLDITDSNNILTAENFLIKVQDIHQTIETCQYLYILNMPNSGWMYCNFILIILINLNSIFV